MGEATLLQKGALPHKIPSAPLDATYDDTLAGPRRPQVDYISGPPSAAWCDAWPRRLVLLGSTGSSGAAALAVVERHPDLLRVVGLSCARNVQKLATQAVRWRPGYLAVLDAAAADALRTLLPTDYTPHILIGREGYAALAALPEADAVLSAQVGAAGLSGTLAAALAGKVICLANKESLVWPGICCGGSARAAARLSCPWIRSTTPFFSAWLGADRTWTGSF